MTPAERRDEAVPVVEATMALALAFALLPTVGGLLQGRFGMGGVALMELACVAAPALLGAALARTSPIRALALTPPAPRSLVGAALAGAAGFYLVAGFVETLQERFMPTPEPLREQLRAFILPPSGPRPLALDLLVLAIVPALCEEALFRGVLLRALAKARWLGPAPALLLSSLAFGAFHFSFYKLVPTALLGLLLGALALGAGSLWPAVLAHALNNTLVVLLVRAGHEDPPGAASTVGLLALPASFPLLALGIRLARRR